MPEDLLPSPRQFISSLLHALALSDPSTDARRRLLLTLHVIFPDLVLPALDLLDRKLLARLAHRVYLVHSAAPARKARRARHLVHLDAWSCSCAAFALDAYCGQPGARRAASPGAGFGGLGRDAEGAGVPCCKHLLACYLAGVLGHHVDDRVATREELAAIVASL